jgi:hypothetical protein
VLLKLSVLWEAAHKRMNLRKKTLRLRVLNPLLLLRWRKRRQRRRRRQRKVQRQAKQQMGG